MADDDATRWVAEVLPGNRSDVVFWRTTTSNKKETLESFDQQIPVLPRLDAEWAEAIRALVEWAQRANETEPPDTEISLRVLDQSSRLNRSYAQWLQVISDDQRAFIEAPTEKSVRLRGPAGSGKTLALTLKAVREVLLARDRGDVIRVLVATHSWALAAEIDTAIQSLGMGEFREIDAFPLLEIARNISPHYVEGGNGSSLIGDDSFSGKRAQLDEIAEVLSDFINGDWVTYRNSVSEGLRARFTVENDNEFLALAWDLLVEFGSVIGASGIFPGAGAEARYQQVSRASWMLPLASRADLKVVFRLYEAYMASLESRSLVTTDQVLADFLSHLETHAWNRARRSEGYDLIFVDEFHLFSPLERQVLHYLTRDVANYPRIFMALDPRQSPSEAFIGVAADTTRSSLSTSHDDGLGDVANFELKIAHRFTPQILNLVKHVHHEFPTLDLGHDWSIDFQEVESSQTTGPVPILLSAGSRQGEEDDVVRAVQELYPRGRLALAIVDTRHWSRFSGLASRLGHSAKYHVSTISGRSDIEGLGYRSRGLVVGPAEYMAGLQFDAVLVGGIPDFSSPGRSTGEKTRILSLLYLAISRAEREVRIFVNEDDGGVPDVLRRAARNQALRIGQGSLV